MAEPNFKIFTSPVLSFTYDWFRKATPKPTSKNFNTQVGVHIEEVHEMLVELTPTDEKTANLLQDCNIALQSLADHLKATDGTIVVNPENRIGFLDAICDQLVTATGSAVFAHMDPIGGLNEVNRSNWSKFDDNRQPIRDANQKIIKGPNYSPPDLSPFV